jgi:hypothetical protein
MAKKPELPTIPQAWIPQFGLIQGGLLDGWSYGLAEVEVAARRVHLVVRATPPGWYFPTDVRLDPREDFEQLQAGVRAVVHDSKEVDRSCDRGGEIRMERVEIRHAHLFCGLGGGAAGFNRARPVVGSMLGVFRCVGGIDVDAAAIRDFERLSGVRGTVLDLFDREQYVAFHGQQPPAHWREAGTAEIHAAFGTSGRTSCSCRRRARASRACCRRRRA